MELKCLRENIQMERLVGTGQSQAVVEGEITLPGGLREEARVLMAGGMVVVSSIESLPDKVVMEGRVVFHTLYTQGDPTKVLALEAGTDFSHTMELPGALPRMLCRGEAVVEHVEAAAYSGRLALKAILQVRCRVLSGQPTPAITGLTGLDGLEQLTQRLPVKRTVATGEGEVLLREEFELPQGLAITDTLFGRARPQVTEVTGGLGRMGVSGAVALEVFHQSAAPGRPLCFTRHTLNFDQSIDLSGEDGDQMEARAFVKDVAVASQDTGEGDRVLRVEVVLGLSAWADRKEEVTLLRDAYTTREEDVHLTMQQVACRTGDAHVQAAESGKLMLMLPEGSPAARGVLCGFASPILTGREQIGGRLTVEGMLEVTLLYMTDDSAVPVAIFQEEPFRATFAVDSAPEDLLTLECGEVDVSAITSDRVEMKYILHLTTSGITAASAPIVSEAEKVPGEPPTAHMVLCFPQPGEELWTIARRYRVPREMLLRLNPSLTQDGPLSTQGIVVWRQE